jgi:DNA invertase Pin-like site-specific DNA recombinase
MLIGYARVSTPSQSLDLQIDALVQAGCDKKRIFTDIASGSKTARPGLDKALDYAREGDILVVWKLDRLGRSLGHLIEVVRGLSDRGIGFKSIQESLDTTTSGGRLIFHVFGAIAEFERDLIRERTNAGLEAARARGKKGGRKRVLNRQTNQYWKVIGSRQKPQCRRHLRDAKNLTSDLLSLHSSNLCQFPLFVCAVWVVVQHGN